MGDRLKTKGDGYREIGEDRFREIAKTAHLYFFL